MPVKFAPTGFLNISTDPSQLPAEVSGKSEVSGAMRRCKNLRLDSQGIAETRYGSRKVNASAVDQTTAHLLLEMGGYRYLFAGTKAYRDETSIATGLTSAKWRGILYNAFNVTTQSIFALNGTDRKRVSGSTVAEWGIAAPTTAPTLAGINYIITQDWEDDNVTGAVKLFPTEGATQNYIYGWELYYSDSENNPATSTNSNYDMYYFETNTKAAFGVKFTYCRKSGTTLECESNPSSATSVTQGLTNGIKVTWPTVSDSQVTHVRIYRTLAAGAIYYYAGEFEVGNLIAALTATDSALGSEVETDHDRPPLGEVVAGPAYNGYCFILKDNLLYYCKANRPEYWPALYYVEAGAPQFPLKAIAFYNGAAYVMNRHEIYMIQGTGQASFFPYPTSAKTGALSQEAVASVKGRGIYRVLPDGIWLFTGSEDDKITEDNFAPIFRGEATGTLPAINQTYIENCWLFFDRNKLYFAYPGGTATQPDNIVVTNVQTGKTAHYDYSTKFLSIAVDRTNDRILAVDDSGFVWILDDKDRDDDNGAAIGWEIESKAYSDSVYKYFPRYAKYDVEVGSGGIANGYVLLNDTSIQTHAISGTRQTKKRLIAGSTGDRLGIRLSGSGSIKIYQVEVE